MGKYDFTGLEDKDIIACYVLANTEEGGKLNEVEFARLLDQRRGQIRQELVTLKEDITKLEVANKIDSKAFYRQAMIYLLSNQENISMPQASELFVKLEQEREAKPSGPYGEIIKGLELPKYGSPKPKVEKTHEEPQVERLPPTKIGRQKMDITWITGRSDEEMDWEKEGIIKLE